MPVGGSAVSMAGDCLSVVCCVTAVTYALPCGNGLLNSVRGRIKPVRCVLCVC
jgi:hypothetical protein